MPPTDDSQPLDAPVSLEFIDDEAPAAAADADEEMSDAPDDDELGDDEIEFDAPGDDEGEDDESFDDEEDEEVLSLRERVAQYEQYQKRLEYEAQQRQNEQYWAGIENQAKYAFAWELEQIYANAPRAVDPDLYVREERDKLDARRESWFKQFYASQNEARRQQFERAAVPTYVARLANHYQLTEDQAQDLLEYPVERMQREAEKYSRLNAKEASYKKALQQARRGKARDEKFGGARSPQTGSSGRAPVVRVKKGSMDHLKGLLYNASRGAA